MLARVPSGSPAVAAADKPWHKPQNQWPDNKGDFKKYTVQALRQFARTAGMKSSPPNGYASAKKKELISFLLARHAPANSPEHGAAMRSLTEKNDTLAACRESTHEYS